MPWCKNFNRETETVLGTGPSLPCQPAVVDGTHEGEHPQQIHAFQGLFLSDQKRE